MRNRDREEIIAGILTATMERSEGLKMSHIMRIANLTSGQAKAYLSELQRKGFIDLIPSGKAYHTTPKGIRYLATFNNMSGM